MKLMQLVQCKLALVYVSMGTVVAPAAKPTWFFDEIWSSLTFY